MKLNGTKKVWSSPFFVYCKKHFCPKCGRRLSVVKNAKVVDSASEEAKQYDFSCGDGFMVGNVKFIFTEFRCKACKKRYSIDEIKRNDRSMRR